MSCQEDYAPNGLLENIKSLDNFLAIGKAHHTLSKHIASANLIPLMKSDGEVRPIAVGETLRRLVSSLFIERVKKKAASLFQPTQVGIAIPGAAEGIVLTVGDIVSAFRGRSDVALLQIDMENAFNTISRRGTVETRCHFPELSP